MARKRPGASAVREPLSYALGSPAKVAALRALAGAGAPVTQREVARRAGVQHRSIRLALDDLVAMNVVARVEGGRDYLVRLNDAHRLTGAMRGLFAAETEHFLELRRHLAKAAHAVARRARLVNVAVFGSVARAQDTPQSDVDVLIIARDHAGLDTALAEFGAVTAVIWESVGCRVRPVGYTAADAARRWRARTGPFSGIARDALVVFGAPLKETLGGTH